MEELKKKCFLDSGLGLLPLLLTMLKKNQDSEACYCPEVSRCFAREYGSEGTLCYCSEKGWILLTSLCVAMPGSYSVLPLVKHARPFLVPHSCGYQRLQAQKWLFLVWLPSDQLPSFNQLFRSCSQPIFLQYQMQRYTMIFESKSCVKTEQKLQLLKNK